jgi:gas vesicle protein
VQHDSDHEQRTQPWLQKGSPGIFVTGKEREKSKKKPAFCTFILYFTKAKHCCTMEHQDKYYKGLFFGALIGGVAGILMGLIFAPHKGTETQQIITGKIKHALDKATDLYEGNEHDEAYSNEAKTRSQEIIDTARDEAKIILNEANSIIRDIKGFPKVKEN